MTNWICKIDIAKHLDTFDEETPDAILKTAEAIQQELRGCMLANRFGSLGKQLVDKTKKAIDADFDYDAIENIFNGVLSRIYDVADSERIWTSG